MTVLSNESPIKNARRDQLDIILPQAEKYLAAQLQCALAADQRALVFSGFLVAAIVALIGGAGALLMTSPNALGYIALVTAVGLIIALVQAVHSARPVGFCYVGGLPSDWKDDVDQGKTVLQSSIELADHYDSMIRDNAKVLEENGDTMRNAQRLTIGSLVGGGVLFIGSLLVRDLPNIAIG